MSMQKQGLDFSGIKNWIFDLDDTLYPPTPSIHDAMSERICAYVMKTLQTEDKAEALKVQKGYYKKYGATVRGLVLEYNISPEDFTDYVHQFDLSCLKEDKALIEGLKRLPGKRFVFTNGADFHAKRVLDQMNLTPLFDGIFSIKEANYIPKPDLATYQKMLETFGIKAEESAMFDDSQANIFAAKKAGIKSVWISSNVSNNVYCNVEENDFCDYQTSDLTAFLSSLSL